MPVSDLRRIVHALPRSAAPDGGGNGHRRRQVIVATAVAAAPALLIRKAWPPSAHGAAESLQATVPALPGGEGLTVVVNRASGSAAGAGEEIAALLPQARIVPWDPGDGPEALETVVSDDVQALGVAGGDGTCASVAGIALAHDLPLAVFAAGTLNHFAKALGLLEFADTARCVESGSGGAVDVARLGGVAFLNTASIGMYPEFVAERDRLAARFGKAVAAILALPHTFHSATPIDVKLNGTPASVWTVFIGNGHYTPRGLVSSHRDHMADGLLDVQIIYDRGRLSRTRATIGSLLGHVERSGVYGSMHTRSLDVEMETEELMVAHDGEITEPKRSVRFDLAPRHVRVYRVWKDRVPGPDPRPGPGRAARRRER
ncbi:MAG: phosphatase family protein [Ilumatobacteraceae bacterium]|nr:phosphatase family protein [Ilumatobacteraceae bacterium]